MASAILRRRPRRGTRVSPWEGTDPAEALDKLAPVPPFAASTSAAVMVPPGPEPVMPSSATPSCFASWRTAGVACTRVAGVAAGAGVATGAVAVFAAACAAGAAAAGAPFPSVSIETITLPTGTTWPSSAMSAPTMPVRGEGISTLALSVITSTSG